MLTHSTSPIRIKAIRFSHLGSTNTIGSNPECEVLVGNRQLMEQQGLTIAQEVNEIMKKEEHLGRITILAAIDSKIILKTH